MVVSLRRLEYVARATRGNMRNTYRILIGKPGGKKQLAIIGVR
jgi:hypothetical protein